jgi:hypothetical protein
MNETPISQLRVFNKRPVLGEKTRNDYIPALRLSQRSWPLLGFAAGAS